MSSINVVNSQFDVASLLEKLMTVERQPVVLMENQVYGLQSKASAYQTFNTRLSALASSANMLLYNQTGKPTLPKTSYEDKLAQSIFAKSTATSSNEDVLTASASGVSSGGQYTVTVTQLAQSQSSVSGNFADIDTTKLGTGTVKLVPAGANPQDANSVISITLDDNNNTLKGLQKAINDKNTDVVASIVNTGDPNAPYKLLVTSKKTGEASAFTIDASGLSGGSGISFSETQTAKDAELTVNNVAVKSASNTVEGAIEGVTLNLKGLGTTHMGVDVNLDSIVSAIQSMVSAYNSTTSYIKAQFTYNATNETAGVLAGDATLRNVQSKLSSIFNQSVSDKKGEYHISSQVGLSLDKDGNLSLDEEKLRAALTTDFKKTATFFLGGDDAKGMLSNMGDTMNALTDSISNPIQSAINGVNKSIKGLQDSIESFNARLDVRETMLATQLYAADQALRLMTVSQSQISAALSGLSSSK